MANQHVPNLIIESGWSELLNRLREKARLWLVGGDATTVIAICWRSVAKADEVKGKVKLHVLDEDAATVQPQTDIGFSETKFTAGSSKECQHDETDAFWF